MAGGEGRECRAPTSTTGPGGQACERPAHALAEIAAALAEDRDLRVPTAAPAARPVRRHRDAQTASAGPARAGAAAGRASAARSATPRHRRCRAPAAACRRRAPAPARTATRRAPHQPVEPRSAVRPARRRNTATDRAGCAAAGANSRRADSAAPRQDSARRCGASRRRPSRRARSTSSISGSSANPPIAA